MTETAKQILQTVVQASQESREALTIAKGVKEALDDGFKEMKDSFRYDMQNIINTNIKMAVIDALKEHNTDEIKPLKAAVGDINDRLDGAINKGYGFFGAVALGVIIFAGDKGREILGNIKDFFL